MENIWVQRISLGFGTGEKKMRYFQLHADKRNLQPYFINWYTQVCPGRNAVQIWGELKEHNYFNVKLNKEVLFMDIISHPYFMVSKKIADVIRMYCPEIRFKYAYLFDKDNHRTILYQIPALKEIECLDEKSKRNWNRLEIEEIILKQKEIKNFPVFQIRGIEENCIVANLEFVESAYRRKVMGLRIREFMVQ